MNDAVGASGTSNAEPGSSSDGHAAATAPTAGEAPSGEGGAGGGEDPTEEKRRARRKQRGVFLDHLIRSIDILIFCELSILYYMDCSLFKFLIRALPHWYFFTPKPDVFPFPPGFQRPYIGAMFGTNLFCIFLHLISEPPAAGEATHGYLHGGMLIDFVGQRSPAPKMRLLFFDLLILGLQILVMSVTLEKQALLGKGPSGERRSVLTDALDALGEQMRRQQDLDLEERGVLGSEEGAAAVTAGESVEMRDLGPESRGRTGGEEDGERDELLGDAEGDTGEGERDDHPLDPFYTGEYIVTRLPILDIMQSQWRSSGSTSAASATSGIQGAGRLVSRRVTFTFGGRPLGS